MKLKRFKFKTVNSTNDIAIRLIRNTNNKFGIIIADKQKKGRGQHGKKWISYRGNLFLSIFYSLEINANQKQNVISKDAKGDPKIFEMQISIELTILENNKITKIEGNKVFLPNSDLLKKKNDVKNYRGIADFLALKLKYHNTSIYKKYKPKDIKIN